MTIKKNLKDINGVIGIRKDKQHKVQGKGKKKTNNDLQNTSQQSEPH